MTGKARHFVSLKRYSRSTAAVLVNALRVMLWPREWGSGGLNKLEEISYLP